MSRFEQHVLQLPRGRISYLLNTIYGPQRATGRKVSANFAVHQEEGWSDLWVLTHLPTGKKVPYACRRRIKRSAQIAALLEGRVNHKRIGAKLAKELREHIQAVPR